MPRVSWERLKRIALEMAEGNEKEREKKFDSHKKNLEKHNKDLWEYLSFEASSASEEAVGETLYQWGIGLLVLMGMNEKGAVRISHQQIIAIRDRYFNPEGDPLKARDNVAELLGDLKPKEPAIWGVLKSYSTKRQGWRECDLSETAHWFILLICLIIVKTVLEAWGKEGRKK